MNSKVSGLIPSVTNSKPIFGTNASGTPTKTIVTTSSNSMITVNVSSGFGNSAPIEVVNTLLQGRMNSIILGLIKAGVPVRNIISGMKITNTVPAVNLTVKTTITKSTNTSAECPPNNTNSAPPTDLNETWQEK